MRVLVTDGETNKALAVVRSLRDTATEIGVASRFPVSPAGLSKHANNTHWVRRRDPESLITAFNDLSDTYDYLLPVGGRTFDLVSEYRNQLAFPLKNLLPSQDSMRTAVRKAETYALANQEGIPTPRTVVLHDQSGMDHVSDVIGYPAVLKTGTETESRFVRVVNSANDLENDFREYREDHESSPIVQELLPGAGRGYFGLYIDGELVAGYAHERIREYPPEGGASACAESREDEELREYSQRLLSALDWTGVAMVEFKEAADGTPKIVEINPKFWGSLDLGIASGLNLPRALLEYVHTQQLNPIMDEMTFAPQRFHWPLSGDLTHAWRRPSSAPAVFRDLLSSTTKSNIQLSDPLPHVLEGAITIVRWDT